MTTKSTSITNPSTLLEELIERSGLSSLQVALAVTVLSIAVLLGTAYLEGLLTRPLDVVAWWAGMLGVVISPYVLLVQPIMRRLRDNAIKSFRPLVRISDEDFQQLLAEAPIFNRRREWLALAIGGLAGTLLFRPWVAWPGATVVYGVLGGGLMYCLLSWFIYSSLSGTRLFTQLQRCSLKINIFDLEPLEPIGRWSLSIALSYIGGNTLSLFFVAQPGQLENIIMYTPLILTPAAVFFLNMMSTHRVMVDAKKRELKRVRVTLEAAYEALNERAAKGEIEDLRVSSDSFTSWAAVEQRVKAVPEWPYSESILRGLVGLLFLPIVVFVLEGLLLDLLLRSLS